MRDMKMTDFPTYPWETLHHVSGQQLLLQYPSWPTCRWRFIRRFQDEAGIIQQKITCADNLCMRPLSMRVNVCMVYIRRGKKSKRTSLTWNWRDILPSKNFHPYVHHTIIFKV